MAAEQEEEEEDMKSPKKLVLTSATSASVTYSFVTEGDGSKSWALCTVNDQTGELFITSDWGSWSHRWHASSRALGVPTLTAFIGTRADVDYLARKLQGDGGLRFSPDKTVHALRRLLCTRRLEDGRGQLENRLEPEDYDDGRLPSHLMGRYTEAGLPLLSHREIEAPSWQDSTRKARLPYLTAEAARVLWDEIEETIDEYSPRTDLVFDRLLRLSGFTDYITNEPWDYAETEQTPGDKALRDIVLPALIKACKDATDAAVTVSNDDASRLEALRAFVAGYVTSRPDDGSLDREAEDRFNRWWNGPDVAKARVAGHWKQAQEGCGGDHG